MFHSEFSYLKMSRYRDVFLDFDENYISVKTRVADTDYNAQLMYNECMFIVLPT